MATTNSIAGSARFTLDGAGDLEELLSASCERILHRVQSIVPSRALEGLALGGGYGRGEGGVLTTPSGDRPYNDLEFYLFISGYSPVNSARHASQLHHLAEDEERQIGIEVEFKILSTQQLRTSPTSMFYYDLAQGHKPLQTTPALEAAFGRHLDATRIPISEATRLLMNRCTGLLYSRIYLEGPTFTNEAADFVGRNLAKAELGLGDALLAARREYHWSCIERRERLNPLKLDNPWFSDVVRHHSAGVDFKLHPEKCTASREQLLQRFAELSTLAEKVWLWVENQRLSASFNNGKDYAFSSDNKCNETGACKNILLNLRTFGMRALGDSRLLRYPRERLLHSLPLLLWETNPANPETLGFLQHQLLSRATTLPELVESYRRLWGRYN